MSDLNQVVLPDLSQFGLDGNDPLGRLTGQFLNYGGLDPQGGLLQEGISPQASYSGVLVPNPGSSLSTDFGQGAVASGNYSVAIGPYASALDASTVAVGYGAKSSRTYGVALGSQCVVSGYGAVGAGYTSNVAGPYAVGIGFKAYAPVAAANSVVIGHASTVNGSKDVVVGDSASTSTGGQCVVIGHAASAGGANDVVVGDTSSTGTGGGNTVVGRNSLVILTGSNDTIVGALASSSGANTVVVGNTSTGNGANCVGVGQGVTASGTSTVVVGQGSQATGNHSTIVGQGAKDNTNNNCIVLGANASANGPGQCIIGDDVYPITDIYIGRGIGSSGGGQTTTIRASNSAGTNSAGDNLAIYGGAPTGSGAGGSVSIYTAAAGVSGTTLRTASERVRVDQSGSVIIIQPGPHVVGSSSIQANVAWYQTGTFSPASGAATAQRFDTTVNGVAGQSIFMQAIAGNMVEASSGVHGVIAALEIVPTITNGAATTNDAAGVHVNTFAAGAGTARASGLLIAAPTNATANYALWVTSGISLFGGSSVILSGAALATNATDGFVYIPTCAGTPTGAPTGQTGTAAMIYDTTNNALCVYNGAWKKVTLT